MSNAYLSQLETGKIKSPSFAIVCLLASAYAVPLDTLHEWLGLEASATPPVICPACGQALNAQHRKEVGA